MPAPAANQINRHHLAHLAPGLQLHRTSNFAAASLAPAFAPGARERQQPTAGASRDAEIPPHMGIGTTSPDVGGRSSGNRWSTLGEYCSLYIGGGGLFRGTVGASLSSK